VSRRLVFKLLGVAAGLVFVVAGVQERRDLARFRTHGRLAEVAPPAQWQEWRSSGSTTYTAEIRFTTDTGRAVVQKHSLPEAAVEAFKARQPVRVRYLPDEPGEFVFEQEEPGWGLLPGGGVLAGLALLLL